MRKSICIILCLVSLLFTGCSFFGASKSDDILPHLISESEKETSPIRAIESRGEKEFATNKYEDSLNLQLEELLNIVSVDNLVPIFTDNQAPELKQIYENAIGILNRYIKNDFNEIQRVHAIHDYLTYYVKYDAELYRNSLSNGSVIATDDPSFNLNGVFLNKVAVCDGFSRAFAFLCGIENIRTMIIEGEYFNGQEYIPHKWNKVEVENLGVSSWFNLDVTMDTFTFVPNKSSEITSIHHGFFLVSDNQVTSLIGGHRFGGGEIGEQATTNYNFHKNETIVIAGETFGIEVTKIEQLNNIFKAIKKSKKKVGKIELRLSLGNEDFDNNNDTYNTTIENAYKLVSNKDFVFDSKNQSYPFARFPGGVFLFLIYK